MNDDLLKILEDLLKESDDEFDVVLKQYKNSRDKLKQLIAKLYMEHVNDDGEIDYNSVYMTNVIDDIEEEISNELETIGTLEVATTTAILGAVFTASYYRSAHAIEQNIGVTIAFDQVNETILNQFINTNWSGRHFSDRIWSNQEALRESLSINLERGIREGHKLDKIAKVFDDEFESKAYQSQRLARTETAHVITESKSKLYQENGITQVQWLATLESNTCDECADLDGQIFDINEIVKPPRHPNCRCDLTPVVEGGTNVRKDNETKEYIEYQDYNTWASERGI